LSAYTVRNAGEGRLTGQAAVDAPFSVAAGGTFTLGAGASQVVSLRFAPTGEGSFAGSAAFTTNAGNTTRAVSGSALTTLPPLLVVEPAGDVDFGRLSVGASAQQDAYTARNDGDAPLTGTVTAGGPFTILAGATLNLASGETQVIRIGYTPILEGVHTQAIAFTSNGGNSARTARGEGAYLVIDNRDNLADRRFAVISGTWTSASSQAGRWSTNYRCTATGTGSSVAAWYFRVPSDGVYEVSAWWPNPSSGWGSSVPFTTWHRNGSETVRRDERANGARWNVLGNYEFTAGAEWRVEIANNSPGTTVIADAIRVRWVSGLPVGKQAHLAIDATPEQGPGPLDVLLEAAGIAAGTACSWDFGDGTTGSGVAAIHTYCSPGTYVVTLTAGGRVAHATVVVTDSARR